MTWVGIVIVTAYVFSPIGPVPVSRTIGASELRYETLAICQDETTAKAKAVGKRLSAAPAPLPGFFEVTAGCALFKLKEEEGV